MKTAVSLPDDLFESADALARRLGISRSRLFATALAEFIAKHRASKVTERLNAVYGSATDAADTALVEYGKRQLRKNEW
jgi:metal-responsive CopG/Arc/MetJ family transcriptional regulator